MRKCPDWNDYSAKLLHRAGLRIKKGPLNARCFDGETAAVVNVLFRFEECESRRAKLQQAAAAFEEAL
jgi:hypothetical protein